MIKMSVFNKINDNLIVHTAGHPGVQDNPEVYASLSIQHHTLYNLVGHMTSCNVLNTNMIRHTVVG